jgi:hypothetical protein
MKWKLLVAVAIVLAILGLLVFTEKGRQYATFIGSVTRSFASVLGNFVGSYVKISPSENFDLELVMNKEAIYGQSFSFSDASFKASCQILKLKIDGKDWEGGEKTEIELTGNGEILVGNEGRVSLKGDAKSLKFDVWKTSDVKVEAEILPESFSLSNVKEDLINVSSVTGNAKKKLEGIEVNVNFALANLKIGGFSGLVEWENQTKLTGTVTNFEINGKKI